MLIESTAHLPISLAMLQSVFNLPSQDEFWRILLRWSHFVAGVTWIGLLYFFNLVNVPVQKGLDADTKKKVNPDLLGRALWYFRWGAVVTVLAGLMYYAMVILKADVTNANNIGGGGVNIWYVLVMWLLYPIVLFAIEFLLIKRVPALTKDGRVFAIVMFLLVLNVWGIIWPNNKRILAATAGTGPAAAPALARQAFIASRTNTWLSLPMLFFMGTSHGDWVILGK